MKNKFINLLVEDLSLDLKIGALLLLIILSFLLQMNTRLKKEEVVKLRDDKLAAENLEKQLPGLENRLRGLKSDGKTAGVLKSGVNLVLKGIFTKGGQSAALIGDDIYQKNDSISGLIVTSITSNTVTIEDPATGEQSRLQLPE